MEPALPRVQTACRCASAGPARLSLNLLGARAFCTGQPFSLLLNAGGHFRATNQFSIELSDSTGSFLSGSVRRVVPGYRGGSLVINMPGVPPGGRYRLRAVSTHPPLASPPAADTLRAALRPTRPLISLVVDSLLLPAGTQGPIRWLRVGSDSVQGTARRLWPDRHWGQYYALVGPPGCAVSTDTFNYQPTTSLGPRPGSPAPAQFSLYPNPARGEAQLRLLEPGLPPGSYSIEMLDAGGRRARTLTAQALGGRLEVRLPLAGLAPGLYLVRLWPLAGEGTRLTARLLVH